MKIYLSGATTDWDNPIGWHEELQKKYSGCEFINPYEVSEVESGRGEAIENPEKVVEPAREAIDSADGMLVKWSNDYQMPGCASEMAYAECVANIPIVMQKDNKIHVHTKYMANGIFEDMDKCVRILRMLIKRHK